MADLASPLHHREQCIGESEIVDLGVNALEFL